MFSTATEICTAEICGKPLSYYFEAPAAPGPGTRFSFCCPDCGNRIVVHTSTVQEIAALPADAVIAVRTVLKSILVIDDEADFRDTLSILLSSEGFYVRTCKSRDEALNLLTQEIPQLILVDWNMPGMILETFVEKVRLRFGAVPMVLFSGATKASTMAESLSISYLPKTVHPHELTSRIQKWCAAADPSSDRTAGLSCS
jgi:CheY-like chemotaxis protein